MAKYHFFISYARRDGQKYAQMISDGLGEKGYHVFDDFSMIREDFLQQITDAISNANFFLPIVTDAYLDIITDNQKDSFLKKELTMALSTAKDRATLILPVVCTEKTIPSAIQRELGADTYQAIFVDSADNIPSALRKIDQIAGGKIKTILLYDKLLEYKKLHYSEKEVEILCQLITILCGQINHIASQKERLDSFKEIYRLMDQLRTQVCNTRLYSGVMDVQATASIVWNTMNIVLQMLDSLAAHLTDKSYEGYLYCAAFAIHVLDLQEFICEKTAKASEAPPELTTNAYQEMQTRFIAAFEAAYASYETDFGGNANYSSADMAFIEDALNHIINNPAKALRLKAEIYLKKCATPDEDFLETLKILDNIAYNYWELGCNYDALKLFEKLFIIKSNIFGEEHQETLSTLNNLSQAYQNLGDYSKALEITQKAYAQQCKVLGQEHPHTLSSLNNLASIYANMGDFQKALELFQNAYMQNRKTLGSEHPDTIMSMSELASVYLNIGQISQAVELFEKAYLLQSKVLGEEHPRTLVILGNLALAYQQLGESSRTWSLFEKEYSLRKKVLGSEHPDTLMSMSNLASACLNNGQVSQAIELFEKAHLLQCKILGEHHPDVLSTLHNLAHAYSAIKEHEKAAKILNQVYIQCRTIVGDAHPRTIAALQDLETVERLLSETSATLSDAPVSEEDEILLSVANFMHEGNKLFDLLQKRGVAGDFLKCLLTSYERLKQYCEIVDASNVAAECIDRITEIREQIDRAESSLLNSEKAETGIKSLLGFTLNNTGIYDVFISFKNEDSDLGEKVYNLCQRHLKVPFWSKRSLPELSKSEYEQAIYDALDNSTHFVVVLSNLNYLKADWVHTEMSIFHREKNEGRKPANSNFVFLVTDDLYKTIIENNKKDIPIEYRGYQIIKMSDYEQNIIQYIN